MARKSMPASRKRPSPTRAEEGEPPPPPPQQQYGKQKQQQVEMDVSVHEFSQGQNAIPSPAELPSSAPSRAIRKKRHSHVRTSLFKVFDCIEDSVFRFMAVFAIVLAGFGLRRVFASRLPDMAVRTSEFELFVTRFDGSNFAWWSSHMLDALTCLDQALPLQGKDARPESMSDSAWEDLDALAWSTIMLSLVEEPETDVLFYDASDMFEDDSVLQTSLYDHYATSGSDARTILGTGASLIEHDSSTRLPLLRRLSEFDRHLEPVGIGLNACKRRKEISMLESCNFLSDHVKELCKASMIVSSLQQVNASTAGYGFDRALQSCAGNFASISDWARFLSSLRTWIYSMAPIMNAEQCASHFINYVQLITEINRSACDKKFFDDPFSFFTPACSQQEMMECLLSQVEEKKNCCPKVSGHQLALNTLVDAFLGQLVLSGKRKKTWFEDLPKNVSKWLFARNEGEQTDSTKSNQDYKPRVRSASCKVTREKPAWTAHQISHDELESWIVKHSLPSIQGKHEELLEILDNGEKLDYDFEDDKKDSFAVWKSKATGQSLEREHEKTLKLLEKVESTENEYLKNYRDIKKLLDNDKKTDCDVQQSRKIRNAVSGRIVGHAMSSAERIYDIASKSLGNAEKREDEFSKDWKNSKIEIEVDLSGKSEPLLGFDASAADTPSSSPYLKRIVKAVSLSKLGLEGESETMVLFKALRSDETEVIVDNGYLRSKYPFLRKSFWDQEMEGLEGKEDALPKPEPLEEVIWQEHDFEVQMTKVTRVKENDLDTGFLGDQEGTKPIHISHEMYSFLNGFSGYNQIWMAQEDQAKTTVITAWGVFPCIVMWFVLLNAPSTFQRDMFEIFGPYLTDFMRIVLEDLSVFGEKLEHL
ncbi:hypothetical protein L7F22_067000 [Adiantum nelumboides]|nr:hypothetical protein [Adiantum nelumboides]